MKGRLAIRIISSSGKLGVAKKTSLGRAVLLKKGQPCAFSFQPGVGKHVIHCSNNQAAGVRSNPPHLKSSGTCSWWGGSRGSRSLHSRAAGHEGSRSTWYHLIRNMEKPPTYLLHRVTVKMQIKNGGREREKSWVGRWLGT